jgi:hypothetical protein
VSKIENFMFPVLIALVLLTPQMIEAALKQGRFKLVLAFSIAFAATFVFVLASPPDWRTMRWMLLFQSAAFGVALAAIWAVPADLKKAAIGAAVASLAVFVLHGVLTDARTNGTPDGPGEAALRETGIRLRRVLNPQALVVAHDDRVNLADLYLMFWSGKEVLDICRTQNAPVVLEHVIERSELYVLTDSPLPVQPLVVLPRGRLYALDGLPRESRQKFIMAGCGQMHQKDQF